MELSKKVIKSQKDLGLYNCELGRRMDNLDVQNEIYIDMKLSYSRLEEDTEIAKNQFKNLKYQLKEKFEELRNQEEYINDQEKDIQRLSFLINKQSVFLKTLKNLEKANQMILLNKIEFDKINHENNISKLFEIGRFNWEIFEKVFSPKYDNEECDIENGVFNLISDWELLRKNNENKKSSVLSYLADEDVNFQDPTHHEFYVFIKRILLDTIKLCDYQNELRVNLKRREGSTPYYFEIADNSNTILGFVEICFNATEEPSKAAGHCFDFALQKINTTGDVSKKEQFIICMSTKDARVFFTKDSKELAAASTIESPYLSTPSETTSTIDNRVLFSSDLVSYDSPNDLFALLCTAIIKMNICKHHSVKARLSSDNSPSITNEKTVQAITTTTTTTNTVTTSSKNDSENSNKKSKRNEETTPVATPTQRRRVSSVLINQGDI
ncbi:hypothetical protein ACTFIW_005944 [Dictyostelium discoideum]